MASILRKKVRLIHGRLRYVNHPGEAFHTVRITTLDWHVIPQNWTCVRYGILFDIRFEGWDFQPKSVPYIISGLQFYNMCCHTGW